MSVICDFITPYPRTGRAVISIVRLAFLSSPIANHELFDVDRGHTYMSLLEGNRSQPRLSIMVIQARTRLSYLLKSANMMHSGA